MELQKVIKFFISLSGDFTDPISFLTLITLKKPPPNQFQKAETTQFDYNPLKLGTCFLMFNGEKLKLGN